MIFVSGKRKGQCGSRNTNENLQVQGMQTYMCAMIILANTHTTHADTQTEREREREREKESE